MRILQMILDFLLHLVSKDIAQSKADTAAIAVNQEASHRALQTESHPADPQPVVSQRLRDGTF